MERCAGKSPTGRLARLPGEALKNQSFGAATSPPHPSELLSWVAKHRENQPHSGCKNTEVPSVGTLGWISREGMVAQAMPMDTDTWRVTLAAQQARGEHPHPRLRKQQQLLRVCCSSKDKAKAGTELCKQGRTSQASIEGQVNHPVQVWEMYIPGQLKITAGTPTKRGNGSTLAVGQGWC